MTDITSIPLNKLVASEDNVRKTAGASLRRIHLVDVLREE